MRFRYCDKILLEVCSHTSPSHIYKHQTYACNFNEYAIIDLPIICAFEVVSFVWLLNI